MLTKKWTGRIFSDPHYYYTILFYALGGTYFFLLYRGDVIWQDGPDLNWRLLPVLLLFVFAAFLFGGIVGFLLSLYIYVAGKWLGGEAGHAQVAKGLALSMPWLLLAALLVAVQFFLFPETRTEPGYLQRWRLAATAGAVLLLIAEAVSVALFIVSLVPTLERVQGFSRRKAWYTIALTGMLLVLLAVVADTIRNLA